MKILYENGDPINYKMGETIKQGFVVGVDLFERPGQDSVIYEASYQVKENPNDGDFNIVIVPESELLSPLHPDTIKFYEESESSIGAPNEVSGGDIDMLGWRKGLDLRPDNSTLPEVLTILMAIQYDKEGFYGSSWKGKGEYRGIMANIDRKYDRLDSITTQEISGDMKTLEELELLLVGDYDRYSQEVGESKVDSIADLTNYLAMYLGYIQKNFPNVFRLWVEKNLPRYLAERISFLPDDYFK